MSALYLKAAVKADEIRERLELSMFQPINIFDASVSLGLGVRFLDINMEGMYISHENGLSPTILLSNQRPLPRRCYTCAHELGHHFFAHGTKLDALSSEAGGISVDNLDEQLVDAFAGSLLMPIAGVQAEFAKRNILLKAASPVDFYIVSSVFGTGYQTLVTHCSANGLIDETKKRSLLKYSPAKILHELFGLEIKNSYFKIVDSKFPVSIVDLEVGNYVVLPLSAKVEGDHLQYVQTTRLGIGYRAIKSGVFRAAIDGESGHFIRIQKHGYIGLAEYRHLENENE
ncbi:MAG: ImmA/IrrE family metallo-endopeptidase [Sphingobacteriales bacterium]|nr:MAG: ImmA/IrrE family metallo-endopeptidase [Sphingobacteriales bacterium]